MSNNKCKTCQEEIKPAAKKCIHCGAYQDFRKYFSLSSSFLAIVVALVSVLSFAIPHIKNSLIEPNSNLNISFQEARNGKFYFIVNNSGKKPGSVGAAQLVIVKRGEFPVLNSDSTEGFEVRLDTIKLPLEIPQEQKGQWGFILEGMSQYLYMKPVWKEDKVWKYKNYKTEECKIIMDTYPFEGGLEKVNVSIPNLMLKRFEDFTFLEKF